MSTPNTVHIVHHHVCNCASPDGKIKMGPELGPPVMIQESDFDLTTIGRLPYPVNVQQPSPEIIAKNPLIQPHMNPGPITRDRRSIGVLDTITKGGWVTGRLNGPSTSTDPLDGMYHGFQ